MHSSLIGCSTHPRRLVRRFAALLSLGLVAVSAYGQITVSNLAETDGGMVNLQTASWYASSFTTDSTAASYTLDSVSLIFASANNTSGNFFVGLYSNNSGAPGSSLETLSGTSNPGSGTHSFTSVGTTLNANTTYWIVGGVTSGLGDYRWFWTSSDSQSSTGGATWVIGNDDAQYSSNSGSTWAPDGGVMKFSVTATAIPEPGTYAALFGLAALAVAKWRRRTSAPAV
jgi:hypothetical protein